VKRRCLKDIGAEFIPSLRFRKDGMAERAGAVTTLFRIANFEDHLHAIRMPEAEEGPLADSLLSWLLRHRHRLHLEPFAHDVSRVGDDHIPVL